MGPAGWLAHFPTPDAINMAYGLVGIAAIWVGWVKYLGPKVKGGWDKIVGFFQAIAGRDAIIDKASGIEKAPAVPPLGHRLASIDDTLSKLLTVIESTQDAHHRIDSVEKRVNGHDQAIALLAGASVEKAALHQENAAFFDMVAKRDSDVVDPPKD